LRFSRDRSAWSNTRSASAGGETLVDLVALHAISESLSQRIREHEHPFATMAELARELERHPDHHVGDRVRVDQRSDRDGVAHRARASEHGERVRGDLGLVGHRDADRLAPDIESSARMRRRTVRYWLPDPSS